jgi:peptidoglycan-N-acetylglucosamine deacetylase
VTSNGARLRSIACSTLALLSIGAQPALEHHVRPPRAPRRSCPTAVPRLRRGVWGFTAPWDPRSAASIACDAPALSVVITGWIRLDTLTAMPVAAYPDTVHVPPGPARFALVTTYQRDRFHRETIARLAADTALCGRVARAIATSAVSHGYRGLVLDFEALTRDDTTALATVVTSIADAAHRRHIRPIAVAVVPTDTMVYASRHLNAADLLLVMLYDQHWATGVAGPIVSPAWVQQGLALRVAETGAARLVAALPTYGYLWKAPAPAAVLSYADARQHAARAGLTLSRDSGSGMLHFERADSAEAWVADAQSTQMLVTAAESLGVRRFALWRLGLEDPAIWRAFVPTYTRIKSR